jgi:hypothetical protein
MWFPQARKLSFPWFKLLFNFKRIPYLGMGFEEKSTT